MKKFSKKIIISLLLLLIWMIIIFLFSSQSSDDSTTLTNNIIENVINALVPGSTNSTYLEFISKYIFIPIRKSAHFIEYFILEYYVLIFLLIIKFLKKLLAFSFFNLCFICM